MRNAQVHMKENHIHWQIFKNENMCNVHDLEDKILLTIQILPKFTWSHSKLNKNLSGIMYVCIYVCIECLRIYEMKRTNSQDIRVRRSGSKNFLNIHQAWQTGKFMKRDQCSKTEIRQVHTNSDNQYNFDSMIKYKKSFFNK